jgi:GntR family transcriptional regulator
MLIRLSDTSPLPLREQIVRRLRELVLSGELPEHTQLPSIRGLAGDLRVGIVTVQRAYEDLEKESVIYARQGKGYFVAPIDNDARRGQAESRVRAALATPLNEARRMGLTREEIERIVRALLVEKESD